MKRRRINGAKTVSAVLLTGRWHEWSAEDWSLCKRVLVTNVNVDAAAGCDGYGRRARNVPERNSRGMPATEQCHLEQHGRIMRGGACFVIAIAGVERRSILSNR